LPRSAWIAISINACTMGTFRSSGPVHTSTANESLVIRSDGSIRYCPLVKWGAIFCIVSNFRWIAGVLDCLVILGSSCIRNCGLDRLRYGSTDGKFSLSKQVLNFNFHRSSDRTFFFRGCHCRVSRSETHMICSFLPLTARTHLNPLPNSICSAFCDFNRLDNSFLKGEACIVFSKNRLKGSRFPIILTIEINF